MTARKNERGMSWDEVAEKAEVSRQTLSNIRGGGNAYPKTIRNVEAVFGWALGSIAAIDDGREPTVLKDPLTEQWLPVPDGDDPAVQLRAIRQRMGATAFWREVEAMRSEETTLGSSASAS